MRADDAASERACIRDMLQRLMRVLPRVVEGRGASFTRDELLALLELLETYRLPADAARVRRWLGIA